MRHYELKTPSIEIDQSMNKNYVEMVWEKQLKVDHSKNPGHDGDARAARGKHLLKVHDGDDPIANIVRMPTLRSGVAQAVGLSLVRQTGPSESMHVVVEKLEEIVRELEDKRNCCVQIRGLRGRSREALLHIDGRTSQRGPGYDEQRERNLDRKQTTARLLYSAGRSSSFCSAVGKISTACRTGFNGKLRTQWDICGLRTNAFEARVPIGVKFHSFEGGAVHVAVQLRAECENGTAWGCFWALLRSSVADFAVRRSFDVEEEGRGERGVEGHMLDGD
ncbi:hypothetical protein DFH09DRAFT_1098008 [Mycena vulgaris]|nr:hypothetical protein DFH09DRAFT_1098008 [Mycena vulgaris]